MITDINDDCAELDALENLIDKSGVLNSTGGTAKEKVEQLIDLAEKSANKC
jgi:hypothetical protein